MYKGHSKNKGNFLKKEFFFSIFFLYCLEYIYSKNYLILQKCFQANQNALGLNKSLSSKFW